MIAFNHPVQSFTIVYRGTDGSTTGLFYKTGTVTYNVQNDEFSISLDAEGPTHINNTNSYSINPSIYTTKTNVYTRLVYEENSIIKYIEDITSNPTINTLSTNDGYTFAL